LITSSKLHRYSWRYQRSPRARRSSARNSLAQERQVERIELFEKYAMLGLQELKKVCYDDRPTDPLLGILALLDRLSRTGSDLLPGLKEML
jgi:hypothetical protein